MSAKEHSAANICGYEGGLGVKIIFFLHQVNIMLHMGPNDAEFCALTFGLP